MRMARNDLLRHGVLCAVKGKKSVRGIPQTIALLMQFSWGGGGGLGYYKL